MPHDTHKVRSIQRLRGNLPKGQPVDASVVYEYSYIPGTMYQYVPGRELPVTGAYVVTRIPGKNLLLGKHRKII